MGQVTGGIAIIVVPSLAIGFTAPRWPDRWLTRDAGPLRLTRFDTRERYERLGVRWWKRHFPEGGSWAGGESKSRLPALTDAAAVERYVVETRRAEWVHWLSCLTPLPVLLVEPSWVAAGLTVITLVVNGVAVGIVRYNRLRLYAAAAP